MTDDILPHELWTSKQVAKFLGLRLKDVQKLMEKGRLPGGFKIGFGSQGEWRFDAGAIRKAKQEYDENEAMCAKMWSIAQVAGYLQMNQESIRRLARQGKLRGIKMHNGYYPQAEWRFDPIEIRNFLVIKE